MTIDNTIHRLFAFCALILLSFGLQAQEPVISGESLINLRYHDEIVNHIRTDLQQQETQIRKQTKQILLALPNEQKLYNEQFLNIKLDVENATREDGEIEWNLVFSISYNCKHLEGEDDDYPLGSYIWSQSNSCRAICTLTKTMVEGALKDYFDAGHPITARIHSTTDAVEVSTIPYEGEYGDFRFCATKYNDEDLRISVNQAEGITTNAQLAFIRAQSVRDFIQKNVPLLNAGINEYEYITLSHDRKGSQYRRSSIELVVHGAFDELAKEMIETLTQDAYVDFNIPVVEAGSNTTTFALIIANENYPAPLPSVPYASNDGQILQQYCIKTLGIPERHVKLLTNATRTDIRQGVQWLKDIIVAVKGQANILVYFAGHGFTDANYNPYILPSDISPKAIGSLTKENFGKEEIELGCRDSKKALAQGLPIDSMCVWFNKINTESITYIFDASFDGFQRTGEPFFTIKHKGKKGRPMRIRSDVFLVSAADFNKTAYSFDEQHHGFFTYFLLKEFKRTKGEIAFKDLYERICQQLGYESSLQGKLQQPTTIMGGKTKNTWETLRFRH